MLNTKLREQSSQLMSSTFGSFRLWYNKIMSPETEPAPNEKPKKQSWLKNLTHREKQPTIEDRFAKIVEVFTDYDVLDGTARIPIPAGMEVPRGAQYIEVHTEKKRGSGAFHTDSDGPEDIVAPGMMLQQRYGAQNLPVNLGSNFDSKTTLFFRSLDSTPEDQRVPEGIGYIIEKIHLHDPTIEETVSQGSDPEFPRKVSQDNTEILGKLEAIANIFTTQGGFPKPESPPTLPQ
jgi:hypothetical protein